MFEYTGQKTTYEEWRSRNAPMQPRRYYIHDTATGCTLRDPSKERGGDPNAKPYEVTETE
jgi:hypothetical protein